MQISRHWRMNATRYRLEGFALPTGQKALQLRPTVKSEVVVKPSEACKPDEQRVVAA